MCRSCQYQKVSFLTCIVKRIKSGSPGETLQQNCICKTSLDQYTSSKDKVKWVLCHPDCLSYRIYTLLNLRYLALTKPRVLPSVRVQCFGVLSSSHFSVTLPGPDGVDRARGGSVQGVHRGTWMERGDHGGNGRNMRERGKVCMDIQTGTLIVC